MHGKPPGTQRELPFSALYANGERMRTMPKRPFWPIMGLFAPFRAIMTNFEKHQNLTPNSVQFRSIPFNSVRAFFSTGLRHWISIIFRRKKGRKRTFDPRGIPFKKHRIPFNSVQFRSIPYNTKFVQFRSKTPNSVQKHRIPLKNTEFRAALRSFRVALR